MGDQTGIVDRASTVPLHHQVASHITSQIADGRLRKGDDLPAEGSLATFYGVSRSVVRQAMASLVAEGLVRTQRGRSAVVIGSEQSAVTRNVSHAGGLAEELRAQGKVLVTKVLNVERVAAPAGVRSLAFATDCWQTHRLRLVDDGPIMYVVNWIPCTVLPELTMRDLEGHSLHALIRATGRELSGGRRRIKAVLPPEFVLEPLGVSANEPVISVKGATFTTQGALAESFQLWHHPSFDLEINASAPDSTGAAEPEFARVEAALAELTQAVAAWRDAGRSSAVHPTKTAE
ncbi:GntR family transcriptional regulator [Actinomyces sp. MRS3W]|uniref:GntR family transcriptional regulator n=1 Tax=Actinomyces sp. MRS3W TaxID=2800796 RepID=UPI0028FD1B98|nr:GntR family transcriptional regulator [Actinomyces sp. MRS3W]MDU0348436.1 GntR family transcriptional regulator [Actinomyces sp. MRS3W]